MASIYFLETVVYGSKKFQEKFEIRETNTWFEWFIASYVKLMIENAVMAMELAIYVVCFVICFGLYSLHADVSADVFKKQVEDYVAPGMLLIYGLAGIYLYARIFMQRRTIAKLW